MSKATFEVKIIRLISGEDIIGFVYEDSTLSRVYIKFPKIFYFNFNTDSLDEELILVDWMPQQAFFNQETSIANSNVLFITDCNVDFGYKYLDSIQETMTLPKSVSENIESLKETSSIPDDAVFH